MTKYALCVGIGDYSQWRAAGWAVPDLPNSIKNAEDFAQLLSTAFGFDPVNIGIQRETWANSGSILAALHELLTAAKSGDVVCVFFSGQGRRLQGLSADGQPDPALWYDAIMPYSGTLISDYDFARLAEQLDSDHINLTVVLDTSFIQIARPVQGAPQAVGVNLSETEAQAFTQGCHTLMPLGLCLQDPQALPRNVNSIRQVDGRFVIDMPAANHELRQAKSVLIQACAADQSEWQVPGIQNSILVCALKNILTGGSPASYNDLIMNLRTQTDQIMTQNVRSIASYNQMNCIPQLYGDPNRLTGAPLGSPA
ncbi:MAG: caspase family protein [Anaerolineae bacterium]